MDSVSVYEDAIGRSTSHVPPADYIVRIKSYSLLAEEAIVEKYESGAFQARGHNSLTFGWEVYAVFCLFLLYQNQDSYLVVQDAMGKERRFNGVKLEWGFDQFIPLEAFNDASNGYLVDDTCVFGAEESAYPWQKLHLVVSLFGWSKTFQSWTNDVRNHRKIVLYPMGNGCGDGDHLSLFLAFEDSTLEAIKVYARYTLRILDQVGAKHKSFQDSNWFLTPESSWGWPRFVSLSAQ
ncbi:hypothetical protein CUMW_013770 [Citrus unshiu]|nr:hypothetical protein CUMW_013770 [Citrus unshiu]